jgi:hypothetical protein
MELAKVDLQLGVAYQEGHEADSLPVAVLTVVVVGNEIASLHDKPLYVFNEINRLLCEADAEGMIMPEKFSDSRDQADGAHE